MPKQNIGINPLVEMNKVDQSEMKERQSYTPNLKDIVKQIDLFQENEKKIQFNEMSIYDFQKFAPIFDTDRDPEQYSANIGYMQLSKEFVGMIDPSKPTHIVDENGKIIKVVEPIFMNMPALGGKISKKIMNLTAIDTTTPVQKRLFAAGTEALAEIYKQIQSKDDRHKHIKTILCIRKFGVHYREHLDDPIKDIVPEIYNDVLSHSDANISDTDGDVDDYFADYDED